MYGMKVAYLTAGAGGMYCGSCLRDNALAAALIRKKRDVALIPVYTPIRTDETDVSDRRVLFGGVNVYLQQKIPLFRYLPRFIDAIFNAPSLLKAVMKHAGSGSPGLVGELTISMLRGEEGSQWRELDKLIDALRDLRPDVVHLPDVLFVGLARKIKSALGVGVVCTLTGEDILLDRLSDAHRREALRLIAERGRDVDGFLCVTEYYKQFATEEFGLPRDRLHYVPLGIHIDEANASESNRDGVFTIGYLARICPEKGLHLACAALEKLISQGRNCRLLAAGTLGKSDHEYFKDLVAKLSPTVAPRFEYAGELDRAEKFRFLRSLDAFTVPTVYREAKGLYLLEAMSQSVPVVQPAHGSFPELIAQTGGGVLCAPNDPADLAAKLADLMDHPDRRRQLGESGARAVRERFTDDVMAEEAWRVFERYARRA
jgi:glycosyltransferase involved in cell wall biosynthesis